MDRSPVAPNPFASSDVAQKVTAAVSWASAADVTGKTLKAELRLAEPRLDTGLYTWGTHFRAAVRNSLVATLLIDAVRC